MEDKTETTPISQLGEFGLIDRLTENITLLNESTVKGIGDDAAVIDNKDFHTLISKDLLVEGIHFDIMYTPLKHLGYKAAVVNFSDIYAMNGTPRQLLAGIALSSRFPLEAIEEIYEGLRMACEKYQVDLVGGDTTSSRAGLFISITVVGQAKKEGITYRSGASVNDLICVSGDLGAAYMGLLLLEREKAVFKANPDMQPDLKGNDYILERQLKPEARRDIVEKLAEAGIKPTSMIDISDGLASELLHLSKASKLGCRIYEVKIPMHPETLRIAEEFKIVPAVAALNGGEDYELLFTISQADYEKMGQIPGIAVIGHTTDQQNETVMITNDNQIIPLKAQGWDGLRERNS